LRRCIISTMTDPTGFERLWWFYCPNGHLGLIDEGQFHGEYSIRCDQCSFHGYVGEGEVEGEKQQ